MKVFPPEHQQAGVFHGYDVGRSRLFIDHRHFPEEASLAKNGENDLPAILGNEHHLDLAGGHEKERVTRIVLENNHASLRVAALSGELREGAQIGFSQPGEQGDLAEDLHGGQSHWCLDGGSVWG